MNFSENTEKKLGLCSFCGRKFAPHEFYLPESGLGRASAVSSEQTCAICVRCLQRGKSLLENRMQAELSELMLEELAENLPEPQGIHRYLDEYVIGQEHAKKVLSVAVYSHYKRLSAGLAKKVRVGAKEADSKYDEVELDKSNILLVGPTGCGKTLLASTLARIVNVPFAIADATTLTEAGYVGDDVENILLRLVQSANYNLRWAEKGIIFLDEIDKIGRKSENASITRDVSGEGVQQALLKIIEGTTSTIPLQGGRKHPQSQTITIDTKNILFICGGAFNGLEDIVSERLGTKEIGFKQKTAFNDGNARSFEPSSDNDDAKDGNNQLLDLKATAKQEILMKQAILPDDLTKFGLIPELVGRLPIVCKLQQLVGDALIEILKKPKNALVKQYEKILSFEDISLEIDETAYVKLAEAASKMKTGARGLRSIMEEIMLDIIYYAPKHRGKKVKLTQETLVSKKFFSQ